MKENTNHCVIGEHAQWSKRDNFRQPEVG